MSRGSESNSVFVMSSIGLWKDIIHTHYGYSNTVIVLTELLFSSTIKMYVCLLRSHFLQSDASSLLCFWRQTCTFIVLCSWKIGAMMYFKFPLLAHAWTVAHQAHSHTHTHTHRHMVVGEVIKKKKSFVRSQGNAVHSRVNPVYVLSLAWPASAGSDGPSVPQWGHNCRQTKENT